jgi:putative solute:sodium symporter small subunit
MILDQEKLAPENAPTGGPSPEELAQKKRTAYWKENLSYLVALLAVWFVVSYGCGILFVEQLNNYRIGGAKLGFWFAQQGSIYVFVVLIFVYVYLMNRLDDKYGFGE